MTDEHDRNARNLLRPDNRDLFEEVRLRLNARHPVISIDTIAADIGVTVDALCRWVMEYREPKARRSVYQSPKFAALPAPKYAKGHDASQPDNIRAMKAWQRQHDGARAARLASEAAEHQA